MDTVKVFDNAGPQDRAPDRPAQVARVRERKAQGRDRRRAQGREGGGRPKDRLKSLETENDKLKNDLAASRKAEKEAGSSRSAMEKMERENAVVRERLEKLIQSLETAEESR